MSTPYWLLVIVAIFGAEFVICRIRRAGRKLDAILAEFPPPPTPDEIAGLVGILTAAGKRGASMTDIALAVLSADYRRQRGGAR